MKFKSKEQLSRRMLWLTVAWFVVACFVGWQLGLGSLVAFFVGSFISWSHGVYSVGFGLAGDATK